MKDSGAGIPEDAIDTIFDEYFQLDNPVRDCRKGLGLGLSICSGEVPVGQAIEQSVEVLPKVKASRQAAGSRWVR